MTQQNIDARLSQLQRLQDLDIQEFALEGGLADQWVREMGPTLKSTQLRKFYDIMKKIELKMRDSDNSEPITPHLPAILRLHVLLAYAAGRETVPERFRKVINILLDTKRLQTVGDYRKFMLFMEAVVAYHKLYEKLLEEQRRRRR